jgi:hypothetical protein
MPSMMFEKKKYFENRVHSAILVTHTRRYTSVIVHELIVRYACIRMCWRIEGLKPFFEASFFTPFTAQKLRMFVCRVHMIQIIDCYHTVSIFVEFLKGFEDQVCSQFVHWWLFIITRKQTVIGFLFLSLKINTQSFTLSLNRNSSKLILPEPSVSNCLKRSSNSSLIYFTL